MKDKKTSIIFTVLTGCFIIILSKAFYVQIINKDKLISYLESQYIRTKKVLPNRGQILDRNGSPLAINRKSYNLAIFPNEKRDTLLMLNDLKQIVPSINPELVNEKLIKRKKFTWIARKLSLSDKAINKIKKEKNIFIETNHTRYYPNNELAAQVLGFVGVDNEGLSGVEYSFNEQLKGKPVTKKYYKDAKGRAIKYGSFQTENNLYDLSLSIDKNIQAALEGYLKEGVLHHDADRGGAAVMNALTGEIMAVANYPTFDPNHFSKSSAQSRKLSFITDPHEPGSTIKTLTVISALENKIVRPDTNYYCEHGKFKVDNHYIREAESSKKLEWLSVADILKYSSNVGTTKIAFDLKYPLMANTFKKMGIGSKTGIEFPGESRGIFKDVENVKPLRLSNISFGQGVATTGIQMLTAYASIANRGYKVKPTIIKTNSNQNRLKRIISKKTIGEVTDMLVDAVEIGTGGNAKIPHFKIAGKTSTAQRAHAGKYEGYTSGFVGFPVNSSSPFVVYVYVDNPKDNGYYGNTVSAPIFKKITKYILLRNKGFNKIAKPTKKSKNKIDHVSVRQSARRNFGGNLIPNFVGLDKFSVKSLAEKYKLDISHKGYGVVRSQVPVAGSEIKSKKITLIFKAPKYD